jgi:hypothetical protein
LQQNTTSQSYKLELEKLKRLGLLPAIRILTESLLMEIGTSVSIKLFTRAVSFVQELSREYIFE